MAVLGDAQVMLATGVASSRRKIPKSQGGHTEDRIYQRILRLEQTLLETQRRGDLVEESRLCNNIAKQYEPLGEYQKALHFHHYDRQICEVMGDVDGLLVAIGNMARVFLM